MAGNASSQTLAVTLTLLSKDEKTAVKNGKSELMVGVINGIVLGLSSAVISFLIVYFLGIPNPLKIAFVVGVSLCIVVITGPFFALLIPIILKKLKFDPAIASGPFITTLIDVCSVILYFGLATLILGVL
jgi:magnesium transporter